MMKEHGYDAFQKILSAGYTYQMRDGQLTMQGLYDAGNVRLDFDRMDKAVFDQISESGYDYDQAMATLAGPASVCIRENVMYAVPEQEIDKSWDADRRSEYTERNTKVRIDLDQITEEVYAGVATELDEMGMPIDDFSAAVADIPVSETERAL